MSVNKYLGIVSERLNSEEKLIKWISVSISLMTASLVFYGFTLIKHPKIPSNRILAGIICISLIVADIVFIIIAIIVYNQRLHKILPPNHEETKIKNTYTGVIAIFILIQLAICYIIIYDISVIFKKIKN